MWLVKLKKTQYKMLYHVQSGGRHFQSIVWVSQKSSVSQYLCVNDTIERRWWICSVFYILNKETPYSNIKEFWQMRYYQKILSGFHNGDHYEKYIFWSACKKIEIVSMIILHKYFMVICVGTFQH